MMERLTFDGNFCDIAMCRELPCQHGNNCTQKRVWERLKQYEDTGLTPGEIAKIREESEEGCIRAVARTFGVDTRRLRELAAADRLGRAVVLLCKVGDTVWRYGEDFGTVLPYTIDLISFVNNGCGYSANCNHNGELLDGIDFEDGDIGKDVFLTREEAETALKGEENGRD